MVLKRKAGTQFLTKKDKILWIDKTNKYIPLLIFSLVIANFLFNFGYFFKMDISFMSVLSLSDYYEGTAPYLILTAYYALFMLINLNYPKNSVAVFALGFIIIDTLSVVKRFTGFFIFRLFYLFVKLLYGVIYKIEPAPYGLKRQMARIEKLTKEFKKLKAKEIRNNLTIAIAVLPLSLLVIIPIGLIIAMYYTISIKWMLLYLTVYIILLSICFFIKDKRFLFALTCSIVLLLIGNWKYVNDFNNTSRFVILNNGNECQLIRIVSKGAFVKQKESVLFVKWEDISGIQKSLISNRILE